MYNWEIYGRCSSLNSSGITMTFFPLMLIRMISVTQEQSISLFTIQLFKAILIECSLQGSHSTARTRYTQAFKTFRSRSTCLKLKCWITANRLFRLYMNPLNPRKIIQMTMLANCNDTRHNKILMAIWALQMLYHLRI